MLTGYTGCCVSGQIMMSQIIISSVAKVLVMPSGSGSSAKHGVITQQLLLVSKRAYDSHHAVTRQLADVLGNMIKTTEFRGMAAHKAHAVTPQLLPVYTHVK